MAATTLGWQWPTFKDPTPPAKSMYSRPSTSTTMAPRALAATKPTCGVFARATQRACSARMAAERVRPVGCCSIGYLASRMTICHWGKGSFYRNGGRSSQKLGPEDQTHRRRDFLPKSKGAAPFAGGSLARGDIELLPKGSGSQGSGGRGGLLRHPWRRRLGGTITSRMSAVPSASNRRRWGPAYPVTRCLQSTGTALG